MRFNISTVKSFIIAWKWYLLAAIAAILVTTSILSSLWGEETVETTNDLRNVRVATVADIMAGGATLSTTAEVRSVSEATISPESGGRIVRVNASLGQRVAAGHILAEIENASQRAAVLQAEGALDAAKAAAGGSRGSALTTVLSAYGAIDSAINDAAGQIYTDPENSQSAFRVSTRDTQALAEMNRLRPQVEAIFHREEALATTLSDSSDLTNELATLEQDLRNVRAYLDVVLKVLNAGVVRDDVSSATISGYVASVTAARTSVTASLSAVISARTSLDAQGTVSASQASVKQAQGAYNAALANLEKTIIRTPISGTLNHFTVKLGDTVSPQQQVAIVSNNGALEAVAYVTEENRSRIKVGTTVDIEGGTKGTVTAIAPALDPVTRRIEVRIGLSANSRLANGESVRVVMQTGTAAPTTTGTISIPITAIKIGAERTVVYSVVDGKLVAKEITTSKLSGSSVQVTGGLTLEDEIVIDARGLKEGQEVTVE